MPLVNDKFYYCLFIASQGRFTVFYKQGHKDKVAHGLQLLKAFEEEKFEYNNNSSNHIDVYDWQDGDVSFNWSVDETFEIMDSYRELKPKFDEPYSKKV